MRSLSPLKAAALVGAVAFLLSGSLAAATFPGFNATSVAAAKSAAEVRALRPLSRVANATWAAANVALSGSKLAAKVQVNATALLPGQITCYYDEVSGIVTSVDDGSGPSCGRYLNAVPVKLGGTKYVSWIDVQLVKGTPYVGRLTFWVKDATTPTFAKGSVKAGGALPYAVRCGRVDDDYLDKALDGLAHAESWPSALTDVEEALESNTQTPLGTAATAEQRKAALASQFASLSAAEGNAKAAAKYNATAKRILAPKRGRGLATLRASCFSNVRAPVDFAEVADAMRISPLTGDFKPEWGWQNTTAAKRAVASTPLTAANILSLGNISSLASRLLANKSAAVSALINDPAKRAAVVTNKTLGRVNTLQRAFNKTRAPLPSVIDAATLRATFTDETLHQQVYNWNDQGPLSTGAAGGISTGGSTFYWIDDSVNPPVAVPDLVTPPPVPGSNLPEGIIELPAGTDPACVTTGTCPGAPPNEVNIIGGVCVIMGANYDCLAPGSACPLGDVPQTDVAGTCPEGGVCCAPPPAPSPPPFVPDTPTPTTPPATAPPAPTPPPAPGPPPPPPFECPFGLLPITTPPLSVADCAVVPCNPCGSAAPDLYQTGALSVYVTPAWSPATPANSATLVCSLDYADPNICSQASQSQNAACTTNDIAVDAQGDFIVLGRSGASATATSGWVIRVNKPTAPGFPCSYTKLLSGIAPWAGLGAAPKSNLLYGIGDGTVFTVELFPDGTASIVSQLAFAGFTGAGDITSAPGNLVYAVSGAGKNAYQVFVDGSFYPTSVSAAIATTGSTYPGAFCTSTEPLAVSSFSVFGRVSSFLSGSFVSVGNSGQVAGTGLTGAAVAPVC